MGIEIKPGVSIRGFKPETVFALRVIEAAFADAGYPMTTLTAGTDGSHSNGSLHYLGCAVDIRTNNIETAKLEPLRAEIARRLGPEFDVLFEVNHYHIEFQPKKQIGV